MYKILLATDGSDHSIRAAEYVNVLLQKIKDARVTVLSVADIGALVASASDMAGAWSFPIAGLEDAAAQDAERARALLAPAGKPVNVLVKLGNPGDTICGVAAKDGFDLIVMGSRGHGAVAGVLLGSVSNKVIHNACAPVLIVR